MVIVWITIVIKVKMVIVGVTVVLKVKNGNCRSKSSIQKKDK